MSSFNIPTNITGMAGILADDDDDLNIDDLEKSIVQGVQFTSKPKPQIDASEEYEKDLESLSRKFGIDTGPEPAVFSSSNMNDADEDLLSWKPPAVSQPNLYGDDDDDDDDDEEPTRISTSNYQPSYNPQPKRDVHHSWSASRPEDRQMRQITNEEKKQTHINQVLGTLDYHAKEDEDSFIQQEEEEDEMARILERIDQLRSNLESEGVNLDRIPEVSTTSSKREAKGVLKILQIKNDRLRYCDMFEEGILAVAYGLESLFNGKRDWFGSKIDLTGWSSSVKVKLRRMRYDTSSFVSDVMKDYRIGHGYRILLELLPSLFLYSRDRRLHVNDNLISDDSYKNALQDLE